MRDQKIGIIFGQEGRNPTQSMERWDTGETFIGFGAKATTGSNRVKEGNFFILDATWRDAFVRGGKQMKMHSPRFATITIPLQGGRYLYLLNAHCPDSSKSSAVRKAFQLLLEEALGNKGRDDMLLAMGDWNAPTGLSEGEDDLARGPHGIALQDAAGRLLKSAAAMHNVVDLVAWEAQVVSATFYNIGSKKGRQIDRAFVMREHQHVVERCVNAAMIVDSDHESARLKMVIKKMTPVAKTMRKNRTGKDVSGIHGPEAETSKMEAAVGAILRNYEESLDQGGKASVNSKHTCLMAAVCSSIEKLDRRTGRVSGWCDTNDWALAFAIQARNRASRRCAKTKSAENKDGSKRRARG
jgi:endonuclease/exonuclease/phosphatase family metal-dependent hydrolase